MGPIQEVCPNVPPSSLCPCTHELSLWAPLQHAVMDFLVPLGAVLGTLRQRLAQPHVAEPILSRRVLACVPLPQPGLPITKMMGGGEMPREGQGLVPVGQWH